MKKSTNIRLEIDFPDGLAEGCSRQKVKYRDTRLTRKRLTWNVLTSDWEWDKNRQPDHSAYPLSKQFYWIIISYNGAPLDEHPS